MAKVKIFLPAVLAQAAGCEKSVELSASTLSDALNILAQTYGNAFKDRIFDSAGKMGRLLNFYLNGKNVLHLKGLKTEFKDGDEISIIPAVAGG